MNKCIYYTNKVDLHFTGEDHVIPAGIGGIAKLKKGIVSDEFNNDFSKIEQSFIRDSFISIPREFHGPGKRGSLSPSKASQSYIHVQFAYENNNESSLGYIELGNPFIINQIKITKSQISVSLIPPADAHVTTFNDFKRALESYGDDYTEILENKIEEDTILLGFHKGKWYLSRNGSTVIPNLLLILKNFLTHIDANVLNPQMLQNKVKSTVKVKMDIDYTFRAYAKIAFNVLAHLKGKEFVTNECFDGIRNWIANGGENKYSNLLNGETPELTFSYLGFPEKSHRVIISKNKFALFAIVSLYGHVMSAGVQLSTSFNDDFNIEMFICDWESKKEYTLPEFLNAFNQNNGLTY